MTDTSFMVFSGNANLALSEGIVRKLNMRLGMATVGRFSDGEIAVEIEENVRGRDVFVIQPTCSPINENLMEFFVMIDALKRCFGVGYHGGYPVFRLCEARQADPLGPGAHHGKTRGQDDLCGGR